jgi:precorrin-2 dehydrogenase/sirohydrochlorin ferrochelatase
LLVGGGAVAARKAGALVAAGARLRVVAPALGADLRRRHEAGEITWEARPARAADAEGAAVVVCASADREADAAVAARARELGIPVAVASDPSLGTATVPATLRRGHLLVAISSGGTSPSFAAFVRRHLEAELGPEFAELADLAARMRRAGRDAGLDAVERERIAAAILPRLLDLLRDARSDEARRLATEAAAGRAGITTWS